MTLRQQFLAHDSRIGAESPAATFHVALSEADVISVVGSLWRSERHFLSLARDAETGGRDMNAFAYRESAKNSLRLADYFCDQVREGKAGI